MSLFNKSHLQYQYKWTTDHGDDPNYRSILDRNKIDRDEGYEVLYFIQDYIEKKNLTIKDGQKIERILRINIPSHITLRSEIIKRVNNLI